jgi:hypothetical protein
MPTGITIWQTFAHKISSFHHLEYVFVPQLPSPLTTVPQANETINDSTKTILNMILVFLLIGLL